MCTDPSSSPNAPSERRNSFASATKPQYTHNSTFQCNLISLKRQLPYSGRSVSASPFSSPFSSTSSLIKNNSSGNDLNSHHHRHRHATTAYTASVMLNRSGKDAVKEYLAAINAVCDEQDRRDASSIPSIPPPIEMCTALSLWSTDAYYAIVISKNGGIATIIRVMKAYLDVSDSDVEDFCELGRRKHKVHSNASRFQACCARILLGLCSVSPRLKQSVVEAGGRDIVLAAIQKFPRSFDVDNMDALLKDDEEKVEKEETVLAPKKEECCKPFKKERLASAKERLLKSENQAVVTVTNDPVKTADAVSYF
jgi:hypothetical protein